jgi:hypothetical protein
MLPHRLNGRGFHTFTELAGKPANAIASELNQRGVATPTGAPWSAVTVLRVRMRLSAS